MRKLYFFAVFLVLYELATYLANDMILPGMIQVIQQFHASQSNVALAFTFYILGNSVFILVAGGLSERCGKFKVILMGNVLFLLCTALLIFSRNISQFMLLRFFQGGGLAVISIAYALIHENFNDKDAVKLIALMGNITILAPLIGPALGSLIVSHYSWHYVFFLTFFMALFAFLGLLRYTPKHSGQLQPVNIALLASQYLKIVKHKAFFNGALLAALLTLPIFLWISQAPNLILYKLHQGYEYYAFYQLISLGGVALSSVLMRFVVDRYQVTQIITIGGVLVLLGLTISAAGSAYIYSVVAGLFCYTLGLGFANGCITRLVMTHENFSSGMLATMFSFVEMVLLVFGMTVVNKICYHFDYSMLSFTLTSLICGIVAFFMLKNYVKLHQNREWQ